MAANEKFGSSNLRQKLQLSIEVLGNIKKKKPFGQ